MLIIEIALGLVLVLLWAIAERLDNLVNMEEVLRDVRDELRVISSPERRRQAAESQARLDAEINVGVEAHLNGLGIPHL